MGSESWKDPYVIRRVGKNLAVLPDEVPDASVELERNGFTV